MPIGLVADNDFEKELERCSGKRKSVQKESHPVEAEIVTTERVGRSVGDNNVPESLRKLIGEEALLNGRDAALQLAADFGISSSSVSAYTKGATSTASYNSPSKSLISHINKSRERAVKRASKTLNAALGAITQEKLDYTDADKLSGIAKDMSVIINNLEPKDDSPDPSAPKAPQFVIFAPQFRTENSFESITVNE